jgi:hypothetical protein
MLHKPKLDSDSLSRESNVHNTYCARQPADQCGDLGIFVGRNTATKSQNIAFKLLRAL